MACMLYKMFRPRGQIDFINKSSDIQLWTTQLEFSYGFINQATTTAGAATTSFTTIATLPDADDDYYCCLKR
ncbi:hypothetical protein CVS40_3488 [Lucilia cuprina]|nr:hypothetical protein CVS40_3488 [Lucilia cuprina]